MVARTHLAAWPDHVELTFVPNNDPGSSLIKWSAEATSYANAFISAPVIGTLDVPIVMPGRSLLETRFLSVPMSSPHALDEPAMELESYHRVRAYIGNTQARVPQF